MNTPETQREAVVLHRLVSDLKSRCNLGTAQRLDELGLAKAVSMSLPTSEGAASMGQDGTKQHSNKIDSKPTKILQPLQKTCTPEKFPGRRNLESKVDLMGDCWLETW